MEAASTVAWQLAWGAVERFQRQPEKVDGIPAEWASASAVERRRAQRLFYGFLRWRGALQAVLAPWLRRAPRPRLEALLLLAGYELSAAPAASRPAVVHHAVAQAKRWLSRGEAGLANAVLRKFADSLESGRELSAAAAHPGWLVERWRREFGPAATTALLEWNQREPPLYACWEGPEAPPEDWPPAPWPGYADVSDLPWDRLRPLLATGRAYIQDPFARHPVELIAPRAGDVLLDACAAPGGKSRGLLRAWPAGGGRLVAADLPGPRLDRLRENLATVAAARAGVEVSILPADLRQITTEGLAAAGAPHRFDGILLDAPCSNTGVLPRRPDARHHLSPAKIAELAQLQLEILTHVAGFVAPGGRLVYSTCSLEREENEAVVEAFLQARPHFTLREARMSLPWRDRHDGGGAFLLTAGAVEK